MSLPDFTFTHPYYLLLLELIPVMLILYFRNYRRQRSIIQISTTIGFKNYKKTFRQKLIHLPFILRIMAIFCLIIAMSEPKTIRYNTLRDSASSESILLIDISKNSLAKDLKPNRFESLKVALDQFLDAHLGQAFGLVTMGNNVVTQVPITEDIQLLKSRLEELTTEENENVNFAEGLKTSLDNFEGSGSRHKQILTFLSGNPSSRYPYTREASLAKTDSVIVYPMILASEGTAPYPRIRSCDTLYVDQIININSQPLIDLSEITGGLFFQSRNNSELDRNLLKLTEVLDRLKTRKDPNYQGILPFAWIAAFLLVFEILARYTFLKSLP